jgi:hypothetical protein
MAAYREKSSRVTQQLSGSQTSPQYKAMLASYFAKAKARQANSPTATAAAGPGAAPARAGTAEPVDPTYDQQIGSLQRRRDDALAALAAQRNTGLSDYGYGATYDDKGNATGLTYDPNNVYSQASLARKTYQQSKAGTSVNTLAARGKLYSGALVNAQNANDSNFSVGEDARQKSLLRFLAGNQSAQTTAGTDYELGAGQAAADRVARAPSSPLYDPSTGPETGAPAAVPSLRRRRSRATSGPGSSRRSKNGVKYHRLADGRTVKA